MQNKTKHKAQNILEYTILLGIISLALSGMSLYFRRGIQAVVKLAADEVGEQKKGALEYDYRYEWKEKGFSNISNFTTGRKIVTQLEGGAVDYETYEKTRQEGILSRALSREKE